MTLPILMPSFAAGELAPALQGRVDLAKYQVGLATCLNWFVHPFGGVSTRAGTAFVGETCDAAVRSRLIPFSFNTQQTYVLEFADRKMRVVKEGGYVLEAAMSITGITRAGPGIVTTASPHGLSSGDAVWLDLVQGMEEVNRRRFTVTVLGGSSFTLGIDTSGYADWTGGGTAARVYTIATPYPEADLALLKYVQSADMMTLTHPSHAPRNLTRTGHASWTLTTITYAPTQQAPTALASSSAGSGFDYVVTAVAEETGEESVASAPVSATTQTSTITWANAAGANSYNVYKGKNGVYGFIGRAGDGTTGFEDTTVAPDTSDTPPEDKNPFDVADKYPGCSTYHEGRQWYARTNQKPQTLYSSASAAFNNMNTSSPSKDSDAITRTIGSREVNEIRFLLSHNVLLEQAAFVGAHSFNWARSACLTPHNLDRWMAGSETCQVVIRTVLDILAREASIEVVVIPTYSRNPFFTDEAALKAFHQKIEELGRKVVYVLSVPQFGNPPGGCRPRQLSLLGVDITRPGNIDSCRQLRSQLEPDLLRQRQVFQTLSKASTGSRLFDAFEPFCQAEECYQSDSLGPLYWSWAHINERGSSLVLRDFLPRLHDDVLSPEHPR